MRETVIMSETEFNQLIEIKTFEEMTESELESYTEIFVDAIRFQAEYRSDEKSFWCPKCESKEGLVEIDEANNKGMASCPNCRMAVVVVTSESEIQ